MQFYRACESDDRSILALPASGEWQAVCYMLSVCFSAQQTWHQHLSM